jgi:hypothetical protein
LEFPQLSFPACVAWIATIIPAEYISQTRKPAVGLATCVSDCSRRSAGVRPIQALKGSISNDCRVIEFPDLMAKATNTAPIGHDPQRHGNVSQIVSAVASILALVVSGASVYLVSSWRSGEKQSQVSDEHVNTLIESKLQPAISAINTNTEKKLEPLGVLTADVSQLKGQVPELAGELHSLQTEVHNLGNTILQRLAPTKSMNSAQIDQRFNQMSRLVEVAFDLNLAAGNPKETAVVAGRIENVLKSKPHSRPTAQAGISAAVHVNGYEAFSRALNEGKDGTAVRDMTLAGPPRRSFDDKNFIVGVGVSGREKARPVYNVVVKDLWQDLAWIPWIHVTFEHDKILYAGDDLFLADVSFKDCEFVSSSREWPIRFAPFGDQKQQELAAEVSARLREANNGPPVNVLVVNGKAFFQ